MSFLQHLGGIVVLKKERSTRDQEARDEESLGVIDGVY